MTLPRTTQNTATPACFARRAVAMWACALLLFSSAARAKEAASPTWSLQGHDDLIIAALFSADGTKLATCGRDRRLILWDVVEGRELARIADLPPRINYVRASNDCGRIAVEASKHVSVWDTSTHKRLSEIELGQGAGSGFGFSPDGSRVAATGTSGPNALLQCWDAQTGESVRSTRLAGAPCAGEVAFSNDGAKVASVTSAGGDLYQVELVDVASGNILSTLALPAGRPAGLCFSRDGNSLVVLQTVARTYDLATLKQTSIEPPADELATARSERNAKGAAAVNFSADGRRLAWSCGYIAAIQDQVPGRPMRLIRTTPGATFFDLSSDGRFAAVAFASSTVTVTPLGEAATTVSAHGGRPVAGRITLRDADGVLRIEAHEAEVTGISFSPDGTRLFTASRDRSVAAWSVADGTALWRARLNESAEGMGIYDSGKTLLVRPSMLMIDAQTGKTGQSLELTQPSVITFSGQVLALRDRTLSEFQPPALKAVRVLNLSPTSRAFGSADGATLLTWLGQSDAIVMTAQGNELGKIPSAGVKYSAAMNADATRAAISFDQDLKLFDVRRRTPLWIAPHRGARRIIFSPDSTLLAATQSPAEPLVVFDTATGKPIGQWTNVNEASAITFSPDSKSIAISRADRVQIVPLTALTKPH